MGTGHSQPVSPMTEEEIRCARGLCFYHQQRQRLTWSALFRFNRGDTRLPLGVVRITWPKLVNMDRKLAKQLIARFYGEGRLSFDETPMHVTLRHLVAELNSVWYDYDEATNMITTVPTACWVTSDVADRSQQTTAGHQTQ